MDTKPAVPSGSSNTSLQAAKRAKNDEFYTRLVDVEKEVSNYKQHFKNKIVYCNCDDPGKSRFVTYFIMNFAHLGLKRLVATSYNPEIMGKGRILVYGGTRNPTGIPNADEVNVFELDGNGDFASPECVSILQSADIVVTNPPFSLFRDYVAQLVKYNKQFLIIGNVNAITYKEVFPLIKENKVWLGLTSLSNFDTPNAGITAQVAGLCRWYTNLTHKKRNKELILYREYSPEKYPKYDNYDAINVDKVADIPCDYTEERVVTSEELQRLRDNGFQVTVLEEL